MKALLLTSASHLEMADVPRPSCGAQDVLIRVAACGICGSDVHGYDGSSGRRQPPLIMGHEFSGVVEQTGRDVQRVRVGDRVVADSTIYCGTCAMCRTGRVNLCAARRVLGVSCDDYRCDGAFADFVAVPQHVLYRVPDPLSLTHAAMIEPVAVAAHAVARGARARRLDTASPGVRDHDAPVLVVGCGIIGLLIAQVLRAEGFSRLLGVDKVEERLALARRLGVQETIHADDPRLAEKLTQWSGGGGVDLAFEVVGHSRSVLTALGSVRKGGTVVLVGNLSPEVPLPLQDVVTREITLLGCCASAGEYETGMAWMASRAIDVTPLISAVAPLSEGPGWFARLRAGEPSLVKVLLVPESSGGRPPTR